MKGRSSSLFFCGVVLIACSAFSQNKGDTAVLKDRSDSISYAMGLDVGRQFKNLDISVQSAAFARGFSDVMMGTRPLIDSLKADSLRQIVFTEVQQRMEKEQQEAAVQGKSRSDSFLAGNKKKKGVQVTRSGLQYQVLTKGNGPRPDSTDTVQLQYKGSLVDGTVFDSTVAGEPALFDLQRVIPGIAEGVQLMNAGSRYRFFIPPDLGYGEQGIPPQIPPNAVLIFEVELVRIGTGGAVSAPGKARPFRSSR
jgi:FKBP-type peptidyl-prolyl cis-trans isomerase FkpA